MFAIDCKIIMITTKLPSNRCLGFIEKFVYFFVYFLCQPIFTESTIPFRLNDQFDSTKNRDGRPAAHQWPNTCCWAYITKNYSLLHQNETFKIRFWNFILFQKHILMPLKALKNLPFRTDSNKNWLIWLKTIVTA